MSSPISTIRGQLLRWYLQKKRDLPWRRTKDPYAVWVSEIMLQQTRVDTVIPYYERFLTRWPTVQDLAGADPDDVKAAWSGLGYYRRLRLMLDAAQSVTQEHDGQLPSDPAALRALPGFGRYTAGAVASIAFGAPVAAVDGNVGRVIARLKGLEGDITKGKNERQVWETASALAPGNNPGDLNQALIELGAMVCTSRNPSCDQCPVQAHCKAFQRGQQHEIPPPRRRATRKQIDLLALLVVKDGEVGLERQPEEGLFGGLLCLPFIEGHKNPKSLPTTLKGRNGWTIDGGQWANVEEAGTIIHKLTHRDLHIQVLRIPSWSGPKLVWARPDALQEFGIPSVTAKCLSMGLPDALKGQMARVGRQTEAHRRARTGQQELPFD